MKEASKEPVGSLCLWEASRGEQASHSRGTQKDLVHFQSRAQMRKKTKEITNSRADEEHGSQLPRPSSRRTGTTAASSGPVSRGPLRTWIHWTDMPEASCQAWGQSLLPALEEARCRPASVTRVHPGAQSETLEPWTVTVATTTCHPVGQTDSDHRNQVQPPAFCRDTETHRSETLKVSLCQGHWGSSPPTTADGNRLTAPQAHTARSVPAPGRLGPRALGLRAQLSHSLVTFP